MPRPKVDRVMRSMRLRAEVDAQLVKKAKREGLSINEAVEAAVVAWTERNRKPPTRTQVEPKFEK